MVPYSEFLSQEKTFFTNFAFLWRFEKVFSAKIYFQAIKYRASGCGALGYCKLAKVFSTKIYFQAIRQSFLPRKKPAIRYSIPPTNTWVGTDPRCPVPPTHQYPGQYTSLSHLYFEGVTPADYCQFFWC